MSDTGHQTEVVRYWWARAEQLLASAQLLIQAGDYNSAANRLYYAAFYGASAALLERQLSFKKHTGVRASFHSEFIKTGLMDVKWSKVYDQLLEDRQTGDYQASIFFDRNYLESQLALCTQFLAELRPLIASLE